MGGQVMGLAGRLCPPAGAPTFLQARTPSPQTMTMRRRQQQAARSGAATRAAAASGTRTVVMAAAGSKGKALVSVSDKTNLDALAKVRGLLWE